MEGVAEQQCEDEYNSFAKRLSIYLKQNHQQETPIKVTTCIYANSKRSGENYALYTNPKNKNLKFLDELPMFECTKPTAAVSGSSHRLSLI